MNDNYTSHDIDNLRDIMYTWQKIRFEWTGRTSNVPHHKPEAFTMADITKSCLLAWLTLGNAPLRYPPPVFDSAPQHRMIKNGETQFTELAVSLREVNAEEPHIETCYWRWPVIDRKIVDGVTIFLVKRLSRFYSAHKPTDAAIYEPICTEHTTYFIVPDETWAFYRTRTTNGFTWQLIDAHKQGVL